MRNSETVFVPRSAPFARPLPGEPDPCGVSVYRREGHGWTLLGAMHRSQARAIHGNCLEVACTEDIPDLHTFCTELSAQVDRMLQRRGK